MKHVIFDFDGTLVDSLPVAVEIANEMVPELNLSNQDMNLLREMPAREIIKSSGIPYWRLPRLLLKGKKLLSGRLDELKVFPGIDAVVKNLHASGHQISVLSSNSEDNIRSVLKREGIEDFFTGVYGNIGLFSKTRAFKTVLKDQKTTAGNVIYIGDEVRDIESARKAHIDIISVTWGYNGKKILQSYKPTYMADTPKAMLQIIDGAAA